MIYTLTTAKHFFTDEERQRYEPLGLTFEPNDTYDTEKHPWYCGGETTIDIDSLEGLHQFIKKWGECIVNDEHITIYDDYIE